MSMKFFFINLLLTQWALAASLPSLEMPRSRTTVSGLSSGAFFAVQMGVTHSDWIQGVASFSGGIFDCAEGSVDQAKDLCMKRPQDLNISHYIEKVENLEKQGLIDSLQNIQHQKIYIFHGQADTAVSPKSSVQLADFYKKLQAQVKLEESIASGHGFPTIEGSVKCGLQHVPWLNQCDFDGAGQLLRFLISDLKDPSTDASLIKQNLFSFDQSEFATPQNQILKAGHIYIPTSCQKKSTDCQLHVAFHGCLQNPMIVQEAFVRTTGLNAWAENNHLVVLYPAVGSNADNPLGCWDWWGYTDKKYAHREGLQMQAIVSMIEKITRP